MSSTLFQSSIGYVFFIGRKKRRKKVEMANCNIEQNSCEQHNDIRVSNEREDITTTETAG